MFEEKPAPTLDDIAAALATVDGQTPAAVVEAFMAKSPTIHGHRMAKYTAGHDLMFSDLGHPWATGEKWEGRDVLMALFVCSHDSRTLFAMIADESFEAKFFEFIEGLPSVDLADTCRALITHLARSRSTALRMESPHASSAQKKTADSDGGSTPWRRLARRFAGSLTKCFMMCRWPNFSR